MKHLLLIIMVPLWQSGQASSDGLQSCTVYLDDETNQPFFACTRTESLVDLGELMAFFSCPKAEACAEVTKLDSFGPFTAKGTFDMDKTTFRDILQQKRNADTTMSCTIYHAEDGSANARFLACFEPSGSVELTSVIHFKYCELEKRQVQCRRIAESETYGTIGPFTALSTQKFGPKSDLLKIFAQNGPKQSLSSMGPPMK